VEIQRVFFAISHHNLAKAPTAMGLLLCLSLWNVMHSKRRFTQFRKEHVRTFNHSQAEQDLQAPYPICKKPISINGGPDVGGYRGTHQAFIGMIYFKINSTSEKQRAHLLKLLKQKRSPCEASAFGHELCRFSNIIKSLVYIHILNELPS
jgi:hypothetical protein